MQERGSLRIHRPYKIIWLNGLTYFSRMDESLNHGPPRLVHRWLNQDDSLRGKQKKGTNHRSTSPNTMSSALRIAVVSASMWPRIMKSIAWRWEKPVGRILQR